MRQRQFNSVILCITLAATLSGCGKKPEEEKKQLKADENIVTLTKANLEHVEIKTEPVALGNLATTLKAAGRVSANTNKTAKVSSTLEGRLATLHVDLNDRVKRGDVLALVEAPELLGKQLELKAPIDGVIVERKSAAGEQVDKTKEIFTISEPTSLWVIAEIKERDIGAVKGGEEARFSVISYPGESFHGKVVRIANEVEKESRTLEVRIEVDNSDGRLKPGMFADVEITTDVLQNVLVISDAALQTDEDRQVVFVALDGNRFQKRSVKLGLEEEGRVQVLDGLKQGDKVVSEGSFILKSEMLKGELGEE
jgi:multidrug efflux pump subunit AcrA (membrane-fusion protein)